jgi:hypothetical protein
MTIHLTYWYSEQIPAVTWVTKSDAVFIPMEYKSSHPTACSKKNYNDPDTVI